MKILVTGGSGFIGSVLVRKLLSKGHDVLNVDLKNSEQVMTEVISVAKKAELARIISKFQPDIVFHLAAIHFIPYCTAHPNETLETNVTGTANLLDACEQLKYPPKVFLASSAAVYKPSESPHHESDPLLPIDIYGETKVMAENLIKKYFDNTNSSVVVCRFSNVYGPENQTPHVIPSILNQLDENLQVLRLGVVDSLRDFIHVQDITDGLIHILEYISDEKSSYRTYNISTGVPCSIRTLAETILNTYNAATGSSITYTSETSLKRKNDRHSLVLDNNLIVNDTGWKPKITLDNGVNELVEKSVTGLVNASA